MADLTGKELSALEDELGAEKLIITKFKNYANMTADPQIRGKCEQIAAQHLQHYNTLLGHLN